jgi:hypothetical protein
MPHSITTKLKPQIIATRVASSECRRSMPLSLGAETMKDQRFVLHGNI